MENLLKNCRLAFTASSLHIYAPDSEVARDLKSDLQWAAKQALSLGKKDTQIHFPGCRKPYQIAARMALSSTESEEPTVTRDRQFNLMGADYLQILEFLMEERQEGKIVIITSNTTNICYHTNDLLTPARASISAASFTGYNYLRSWRSTREDDPTNPQRLNPQFDRLRELLARDGYVPGYEYTLFRPDDAHCSYQTDYYLCRDYCGDEVRIGVSKVEDWRLLEPSPVA